MRRRGRGGGGGSLFWEKPDSPEDGERGAGLPPPQRLPPQHVAQCSSIPLGRGLGSSAAAIVAGVVAANALLDGRLDRVTLLRIAVDTLL